MREIKLPFDLLIGDTIGKYVATKGYGGDTLERCIEHAKDDKCYYYVINKPGYNIKVFGLTLSK